MTLLYQCLSQLPSRSLKNIVTELSLSKVAVWGQPPEKIIAERMLELDFLAGLINKLNKQELRAVSLFAWWPNLQGVPKPQAETILTGANVAQPLENLASLSAKGLIYKVRYGGWEYFFMPEDLSSKISITMARLHLTGAERAGDSIREHVANCSFYEDALTFLAYANKNKVALTQKGTIHKRILEKILAIMHVKEDTSDTPPNLNYPQRFWMLLNYCSYITTVFCKEQVLCVQTYFVDKWTGQNTLSRISYGAAFIWEVYRKTCHNVQARALQELIIQMEDSRWYGYEELAAAARKMTAPFPSEEPGPEVYLDIFLSAGLLVEGLSSDGDRMVKLGFWSPQGAVREFPTLPEGEDGFWVQPNFEVLAPPRLKLHLRWQLELMADPVKVDHAYTYAITKETVLRYFDNGGSAEVMIDFLESHGKTPIPQNIVFTIQEWGSMYGRVSFLDVFLLRCDSEQLADELSANSKIRHFVKSRFDTNHLIILRNHYEAVLAALQKEGYFPRKGIIVGGQGP